MEPVDPAGEETDRNPDGPSIFGACVAEATGGAVQIGDDPDAFEAALAAWMEQNPDKVVPFCGHVRKMILEEAERDGIYEAAKMPPDFQETLHQVVLMMAGTVMKSVNDRIQRQLHKIKRSQRVAFLDQAVADLGLAEDYLLDAMEPERSEWLALVRPLRADCHRAAEQLRREPPPRFPFLR